MFSRNAAPARSKRITRTRTDIVVDNVRKANLRVSQTILYISLCGIIVFVLNELNIFYVAKTLMRYFALPACVSMLFPYLIIKRSYYLSVHPTTKYILMAMTILNTAIIGVALFNYVQPIFVLPALAGVHYRSNKVRRMGMIGAVVSALVCPSVALLLGTWDSQYLSFLTYESMKGVFAGIGNDGLFEYLRQSRELASAFASVGAESASSLRLFMYGTLFGKAVMAGFFVGIPNAMIIFAFSMILSAASKTNRENMDERFETTCAIQDNAISAISDIIENRDYNTGGHVKRTSDIVAVLTRSMRKDGYGGHDRMYYDCVVKAAPMHDLGKIAIQDSILRKPGRLTPEEFEEIKTHSVKSEMIIQQVFGDIEDEVFLNIAKNLARSHHERYDGTGYPDGLKGEEIPLEARIMTIADVYDALVSKRCYKEEVPFDEAFKIIEESMGAQFDPKLNKYFLENRRRIESYYQSVHEEEARQEAERHAREADRIAEERRLAEERARTEEDQS